MDVEMWCERHQHDLRLCPRVWFWPCKPVPGPPNLRERFPAEPYRHPLLDLTWTIATVVFAVWVLVGFLELIH